MLVVRGSKGIVVQSCLNRGINDWAHISGRIKTHENLRKHKFLLENCRSDKTIEAQLFKKLENLTKFWRDVLHRIINVTVTLAMCNLPFRGQREEEEEEERKLRLTASMFGRVIKRRVHSSCHNSVKSCLIQNHFYSEATENGIVKEQVAIERFQQERYLTVKKSGLWVDLDYGFLAASPDVCKHGKQLILCCRNVRQTIIGIVGDEPIVEVKSLYSARDLDADIDELISLKKFICLKKKSTISLKRITPSIQGQLNITCKKKCYFIVYINDKTELFVEEIERDQKFWNEQMLPELKKFFINCIASEIIENNIGQGKRYKDPAYILKAIQQHEQKHKRTKST